MSREYRVNGDIKANFVNIVKEDGTLMKKVPFQDALKMAYNINMDIVEVAAVGDNGFPVCKILSYEKLMYRENKNQKSHNHKTETKEIRFNYNIGENDLKIKNKKVIEFLEKRNNVKYVLRLKGREKNMIDIAKQKMQECLNEFQDKAKWNKVDIASHDNAISITVMLNPA